MEKNLMFDTAQLKDVTVHLAWAQAEIFSDDVERIQVLAAGDERSVNDLRIEVREGTLLVEQPQYGITMNITDSRWMQVCVRIPREWNKDLFVNTISGLLSARKICGGLIVLDTVSGDLRGIKLSGKEIKLRTISGDVRAEGAKCEALSVRSVSGDIMLDEIECGVFKGNTVSGEQRLSFNAPFERMDINSVSGDISVTSPIKRMNVFLRSIGGRVKSTGVDIVDDDDSAPSVRVTGVSADLKLMASASDDK